MRIGIDIRLQNESGVGRYIRNLTQWLKKIDSENEYRFLNPPFRWHSLAEQLYLPGFLQSQKLDLVHFPYFNSSLFYPGKFVVTIHDLIIDEFATGLASTLNPLTYQLKRAAYRLVMLNNVYRARKILVPSQTTRREILQHYRISEDKIKVTYEGVDDRIAKPQAPKNVPLTNRESFFLYVGNAYPHKNLPFLLHVFADLVKAKQLSQKLVFVGKEDFFYRRLRQMAIDLKIERQVIFGGLVSDSELAWLYDRATALVSPSLKEGFALPALEAMRHYCPLILSDIAVFREICLDHAVYFSPKDSQGLKQRLLNVKRSSLQQQAAFRHSQSFNWEETARQTLAVYQSLA